MATPRLCLMTFSFQAVIFDFDLTLADSTPGFIECHTFASLATGLVPPDTEAIGRSIGVPLSDAFRLLHGEGLEDALDAYLAFYQQRADEVMAPMTVMLPGSAETIRGLHDAGFSLGIVSQKLHRRVEAVLEREGLAGCFGVLIGGDDAPEFKPDPKGLILALDWLLGTPETTLYVGDTVIDAETASRADVSFAAVLTGHTRREEFGGYSTIALLESVADLPAHLGLRDRAPPLRSAT